MSQTHTQEAILDKIIDWIRKKIDMDTFIIWLYSYTVVGKTTISHL